MNVPAITPPCSQSIPRLFAKVAPPGEVSLRIEEVLTARALGNWRMNADCVFVHAGVVRSFARVKAAAVVGMAAVNVGVRYGLLFFEVGAWRIFPLQPSEPHTTALSIAVRALEANDAVGVASHVRDVFVFGLLVAP